MNDVVTLTVDRLSSARGVSDLRPAGSFHHHPACFGVSMTSQCSQQTDAFQEISRILASRDGRVLEFEILPPAFGPILEDGCSIGLTKKYIVQAFVTARRVFFDGLQSLGQDESDPFRHGTEGESSNVELDSELVIASEIILLFDCEHLTACNWRKRRLCALGQADLERHMQELLIELSLTATYLCSPLHRHTKSPTLWQHRQWIRSQLIQGRIPDLQASENILQAELAVVLRAGELHPRNYYAFSYMRHIHRLISSVGGEVEGWSVPLARSIISSTLDWCLAHPTDISGLMFLLYLSDAVPDAALRLDIVGKVARFAVDVGWEGESIWTFVDLAFRRSDLVEPLDDSRPYPWNVLRDPIALDESPHGEDGRSTPWKSWLGRAQAYWAQSTNIPLA
ncbi:hypothetical protein BJX70DRAFT_17872 [Aspergillus crustosus]